MHFCTKYIVAFSWETDNKTWCTHTMWYVATDWICEPNTVFILVDLFLSICALSQDYGMSVVVRVY